MNNDIIGIGMSCRIPSAKIIVIRVINMCVMVENNLAWTTDTNVSEDDVDRAVRQIILQNEEAYKDTLFQLTLRQRDLLVAIGREGKATQITGMAFVKRYHLSSASSVQKAAQILLDKQLVTQQQGVYEVYDKFLAEWIRTQ